MDEKIDEKKSTNDIDRKYQILPFIIGGMVHDINNFLWSVIGHYDLLEAHLNSESQVTERDKLIELCKRGCAASKMVATMVDFIHEVVRPFYSKDIVEAGISNFRNLSQKLRCYILSNYPNCKLIFRGVKMIPNLLLPAGVTMFVVDELIRNGINSCYRSKSNCRVEVIFHYDAVNGILDITCKDSGTGFSESLLAQYQQGVFQLSTRESKKGFGLYIITEIAKRINGRVIIRNRKHVGAIVKVLLSVKEVENGANRTP